MSNSENDYSDGSGLECDRCGNAPATNVVRVPKQRDTRVICDLCMDVYAERFRNFWYEGLSQAVKGKSQRKEGFFNPHA